MLIQLPNCVAFATVLLGAFASGLTATLVSPALTSGEISWILQNARPRVIITATACLPAMRDALAEQDDKAYFSQIPLFTLDPATDAYPARPTSAPPNDWSTLLTLSPSPLPTTPTFPPSSARERTAVILWSSGTSGRSKGVLLSHHALNFSMASLWHDSDHYLGVPPRWLAYVPFYHVFGLCNILLVALCTGATVYTMSAFSLDAMLHAVRRRRITYLHMAPPIAVMLAKAPAVERFARRDINGRNAFSSVVGAVTGGAPLGHEVVVRVWDRCGFRIRLGYGLSETCSTSLQRGLSKGEMMAQAGDTGSPHWGIEVCVVSGDHDFSAGSGGEIKKAKTDEEGEILIRGGALMSAYLPQGVFMAQEGDPGLDMSVTEQALTPDGWFRTGDVGAICPAGRLRITDRLKELIKVRAYQVAPAELEAVLCSSPDVGDAGVVGVYDEGEATEWPRAYVVPSAAIKERLKGKADLDAFAEQIREYVEKRTARYKWLKGGIVFVEQIPKSPSGKILRRVLRDKKVGTEGYFVRLYEPRRVAARL